MATVAFDTSTIVYQDSMNNTLTLSVTDGSVAVTPDSVAISVTSVNGTTTVAGSSLLYTPNAGFYGSDSVQYTATYGGLTSNVATASISVTAADCTDIGRSSRSYVTAYNLNRPQIVKLRRYAKRCFVVDLNGAMDTTRKIVTARWDCTGPWAVQMSNARIINGQRKSAVDVASNFAGWSGLLCTVTLDNGEVYNAEFSVTVSDAPLYPGAVYTTVTGPFVLITSV